jgi:HlyD family secretion protein
VTNRLRWKRWLWIIALGGIAAVGIGLGLRPQPVLVEVVAVVSAPMRVLVEEEGKTRLRSRYMVSAPVGGFLRRLPWKAGDSIRSGATVAMVDPPRATVLDPRTRDQFQARVGAADAGLAVAEARVRSASEQVRPPQSELAYWRQQRDREEVLLRSGDIAAERVDRTKAEVRRLEAVVAAAEQSVQTARAEVESARAEAAAARASLRGSTAVGGAAETVSVLAPADGRVIRVVRESEGVVNPGEPLLEVGNSRAIEVEVEVLSPDAVKIGPGTRVILSRWGGEQPLEARVRVIEPGGFTKVSALGVEEQRVRVVADITSPEEQWRRLGDGYRVEAGFVLWEGERVLQVPSNATFRQGDSWAVFVAESGFARRRAIQVGHRTGLATEVTGGLREGESVIAHPDETVADGKQVLAR